jgi:hypothetical protein
MSRHIRNRIAKLVQDQEEAEEVVFVFQSWALGPPAPKAREAPAAPPAPTQPESPSGAPPQGTP